ncbi:MAG: hypothetical protein N2246_09325, partial [Candidatus Sumerlaeia bacterium]|nr:hypothetical protein [Candidatus Sumerlaeia bacterium]
MYRVASELFIFFVCFLLLILLPRPSFGYTTTLEFTPPYYNSSKWTTALVPYVSWGSAGVNFSSGAVGVYAAGWIGGGKAFADQFVKFYVPAKSSIKVTAKLKYLGGTINWGFGSWSGTQWEWNIDNGSWHLYDIDPALGWDDVTLKILDLILCFAGGPVGKIQQAILFCDMINDTAQLAYQLANYGGKTHTAKFSLTVDEGYHTLGFGISAYAAGCFTGTGYAAMLGQVEKITLQITNDCTPPDLSISYIEFPTEPIKRNKPVTIKIGVSNHGSVAYSDKISLQLGTQTTTMGGYEECFDQHSTINHYCTYSFPQKGSYLIKAWADPDNVVPETNETNNELTTYTRVIGDPPNKPLKPGAVPPVCYRNHTYNFWSYGNDPDNDTLRYNFRVRDEQGNEWYSTWSTATSTSFTPTKENKMTQTGSHYVSARTIDNDGLVSPWSDEAVFFIEENSAPEQPVIDAPNKSYCGENRSTQIWFSSDDAEDDDYWFWINWGDGSPPEKIPAAGQDSRTAYHKYITPGTYTIQAQAEDEYGAKSSID